MVRSDHLDAPSVYPGVCVYVFIVDFPLFGTHHFLSLGAKPSRVRRRVYLDPIDEPNTASGNAGLTEGPFIHYGASGWVVKDPESQQRLSRHKPQGDRRNR